MEKKIYILLTIVLFILVLIGCRQVEPEPTPTPIPTPIIPEKPTYVVQRGTIVEQLEFLARVAPVEEYRLFFRMGGHIKAVYVERGDRVTAGQVLAELDVEDLHKQLAQAQVSLESAQLQLEGAKQANAERSTDAEIALAKAELRLAKARAQDPSHSVAEQVADARIALAKAELRLAKARAQDPSYSVAIAKARVEQAFNSVKLAQAAYDRRAAHPGIEASSEALRLQDATLAYQVAQTQYDQALQSQKAYEYDVQIAEKDTELARTALERLEESVDSQLIYECDVQVLEKDVELARMALQRLEDVDPLLVKGVETKQLSVDRLKAQVESAQVTSPLDGEIMSLSIYAGRSVAAFKPAIIVADLSQLELSAELTSSHMQDLTEGMECTIRLSDKPGQDWTGQIRRLPYPYGGGGGTTALDKEDTSTRVGFDMQGLDLEAGDLAKVIVVLEQRNDVLYLPPQAVRSFEGRKYVLVQEGDGRRKVDVKLGLRGEDRVEILEEPDGIKEGQTVIGL